MDHRRRASGAHRRVPGRAYRTPAARLRFCAAGLLRSPAAPSIARFVSLCARHLTQFRHKFNNRGTAAASLQAEPEAGCCLPGEPPRPGPTPAEAWVAYGLTGLLTAQPPPRPGCRSAAAQLELCPVVLGGQVVAGAEELMPQGARGVFGLVAAQLLQFRDHVLHDVLKGSRSDVVGQVESVHVGLVLPFGQLGGSAGTVTAADRADSAA